MATRVHLLHGHIATWYLAATSTFHQSPDIPLGCLEVSMELLVMHSWPCALLQDFCCIAWVLVGADRVCFQSLIKVGQLSSKRFCCGVCVAWAHRARASVSVCRAF